MSEEKTNKQDTGLSCLLMVAAYYGIPADLQNIKHNYNLQERIAEEDDLLRIAKGLKMKGLTTQTEQETSSELEYEVSAPEMTTETAGDNTEKREEEKTENGNIDDGGKETTEEKAVMEEPENTVVIHSDEDAKDDMADQVEDEMEKQDEDEEIVSDSLYEQGLTYYLNRYQYDCEADYLQSYLEYVKLEVVASEEMYNMGLLYRR